MLIVLIARKRFGFGLTILEYFRIVNYSELPIPTLMVDMFFPGRIFDKLYFL